MQENIFLTVLCSIDCHTYILDRFQLFFHSVQVFISAVDLLKLLLAASLQQRIESDRLSGHRIHFQLLGWNQKKIIKCF